MTAIPRTSPMSPSNDYESPKVVWLTEEVRYTSQQ